MRVIASLGAVLFALVGLGAVIPATAGAAECPNEQARSESGSKGLPDCRVYELVSPTEKTYDSGDVRPLYSHETIGRPMESSPEGDGVTYLGEPFYQALSGVFPQGYYSVRGPNGWITKNLKPAQPTYGDVGFSAALGVGVTAGLTVYGSREEPLAAGVPAGYGGHELYLLQSDGTYTPLITERPPNEGPGTFGHVSHSEEISQLKNQIISWPLFVGASVDYSHIFFEANDALTPNASNGGALENNLYEWFNGTLHLVNVLPDGSTQPDASFGVEYIANGSVFTGLKAIDGALPNLSNAISTDGSRVFWTDEENGNLYVRENGDQPESPLDAKGNCTVPVDACSVLIAEGAQFQTASTDGSKVFFTKGGDLYEYDLQSAQTTDLAPGGEVQGLAGASDDGSYIYFVANHRLTTEPRPGCLQELDPEELKEEEATHEGRCRPRTGGDNLYLWHGGTPDTTAFIATLAPLDNEISILGYYDEGLDETKGDWSHIFAARFSRVSPSGEYLGFVSTKQLTHSPVPVATGSPESSIEIYLYNAASGRLSCASCRPDGQTPAQPAWYPVNAGLGDGLHQPRWLDDSGQVFFFDTEELVPGAPEGGLYEYEEGHVYLLAASHAEAGAPSVSFLDASESGSDVFFRTSSELVPEDQDELGDVYDARVNGHLPAPVRAPCVGEECQGEATHPFLAPGLATIALGPSGNLAPAPPVVKPPAKSKAKKHAKVKRKKRGRGRRKRTGPHKRRAHR